MTSSQRKGRRAFQLLSLFALFFLTFHVLKNVVWLSTLSEKHRRTQQAAEQLTFFPPPSSPWSMSSLASSPSITAADRLTTNTTWPKVNVRAQPPIALSEPQSPPTSRLPNHVVNLTRGHDVTAMATTDNMAKSATTVSLPLCTRQQIQTGEWSRLTLDRPPYVSRNKHLRCYPDEVYKTTPWTHSWDWQPSDKSCTLTAWNATEFCSIMQHVTISIIGDSLSWEQYSSLLQLLGQHVRQTDQHKSKAENRNLIQLACDEKTSFVFRNDPRLEHITESIEANFPLVLVLNRGAHYANDSTLLSGIQRNVQEIQTWKEKCIRTNLRCHLFWRTTVPGHPLCVIKNETAPINNLAVMEERVNNLENYDNVTINFHWHDFQHQNELILQELEPFHENHKNVQENVTYHVIDAYHLNMLRPDEHRAHADDCLHNCYPGKMDVYNQLLLHFLKMDRTLHDALRLEHLFQFYQTKRQEQEQQHNDTSR